MTLLIGTWYGVSLSQSPDGGESWGPPSPFFPHGRHKEFVEVMAKVVGGSTVEVCICSLAPFFPLLICTKPSH
jgi:hypothetical protein